MEQFFARFVLPYNKFWAFVITTILMAVAAKFKWNIGVTENDVMYFIGVVGGLVLKQVPNVPNTEVKP